MDVTIFPSKPLARRSAAGATVASPASRQQQTLGRRPGRTIAIVSVVLRGRLLPVACYMALDVDGRALKGEFLHTARVVNTMVDQLSSFASEVTRVAREVGTEGILGGQADVRGVGGVWKDLTDSVNSM